MHCAARPSRCGAWRSSPTPMTCARRRAGNCCSSCGMPAQRCAPTIPRRWTRPRRIFGERDDLCCARSAGERIARRRCAGRGHRMEAVPQPGFHPPAGTAWRTRWCSTGATCTNRTKSRTQGSRITASAAAVRSASTEHDGLTDLEQRLVELEMRLAFQEQALTRTQRRAGRFAHRDGTEHRVAASHAGSGEAVARRIFRRSRR